MKSVRKVATIVGILFAATATATFSEWPESRPAFQICCDVAGVDCLACQTFQCCLVGCQAGRIQSPRGHICLLVNCYDQCAAAFVKP